MAARAFFEDLQARIDPADLDGLDQSYRFEVADEGDWNVRVRDGRIEVTEGAANGRADATIRTSSEVFDRIAAGKQSATMAYMSGKVKIDGDLGAVMKLQKLFSRR